MDEKLRREIAAEFMVQCQNGEPFECPYLKGCEHPDDDICRWQFESADKVVAKVLRELAATRPEETREKIAIQIRDQWAKGKHFLTDVAPWAFLSDSQKSRWLSQADYILSLIWPIAEAKIVELKAKLSEQIDITLGWQDKAYGYEAQLADIKNQFKVQIELAKKDTLAYVETYFLNTIEPDNTIMHHIDDLEWQMLKRQSLKEQS